MNEENEGSEDSAEDQLETQGHEDDELAGSLIPEDEILSLFQELRKESTRDDPFRDLGKVVELLCSNKPMQSLVNYTNMARTMVDTSVTMQILNSLIGTWASIITDGRPSVYAVPQNSDLQAVSAAKIATKFIEYLENEEGTNDKWHQSAIWSAQHGTSLMKVIYSPITNRIEWSPLSIFDCFLQNRARAQDVEWCLIRSYVTPYEAKELMKQSNPEAYLPPTVEYRDAFDIQREGVEKWEIWYLPCSRFEKGLYACVVGSDVVEAMDYPYTFAEPDGDGEKSLLPVVWWNCRRNRGATLGTSWANDCTPIQASINNLFSKVTKDALEARQMMILPISLRNTDLIDDDNARIYFDPASRDDVGLIGWTNPAPVDAGVQSALKQNIESMYVTSGISQTTTGNTNASDSGKKLAYQSKLDADKHADAAKNFALAQKGAWELTLKLVQKYYTAPRQFAISGEDPISFMGSDLAGISVKLEPRSSYEGETSKKTENAKEDMGAGFAGREALLEASPSPMTAGMAMFADDLIGRFLAGEDVQITPETLPAEIFVAQIDKRIHSALLARDSATAEALNGFKAEFLRSLASAQAPDAAPQAAADDGISAPIPGAGEAMDAEAAKGLSKE